MSGPIDMCLKADTDGSGARLEGAQAGRIKCLLCEAGPRRSPCQLPATASATAYVQHMSELARPSATLDLGFGLPNRCKWPKVFLGVRRGNLCSPTSQFSLSHSHRYVFKLCNVGTAMRYMLLLLLLLSSSRSCKGVQSCRKSRVLPVFFQILLLLLLLTLPSYLRFTAVYAAILSMLIFVALLDT